MIPATAAPRPRSINNLPGPRGLPLIGNLHQLDYKRMHVALEEWARIHGGIYQVRMGPKKIVVVSEPDLIRVMLRERPDRYMRFRAIGRVIGELGMTSLFSSEGVQWQRERRVYMSALNIHQTRPFFTRLVEITGRLRTRWLRAAAEHQDVDVLQDLMKYTLDVITLFAFGYDANTLEGHQDQIQQRLSRLLPVIARRTAAPFPYWHYYKLPADAQLERDLAGLEDYVNQLIADARQRMAAQPELQEKPSNLIEAFIASRDADGSPFSDREIYANALGTLVAGEDTTATTIAWMLYFLAQHPEAQSRLAGDMHATLGDRLLWERLEDGERLRYADALMSETFRFRPIAPALFLCTNADVELGGYALPKHTDVLAILRNSSLSDTEFSNATRFHPDRWITEPLNFAIRPPFPFGSGPRMCPGRNLAQLEIKSVAAMVGRNFEVAFAPDSKPVQEVFSFTLAPENLRLRFKARS